MFFAAYSAVYVLAATSPASGVPADQTSHVVFDTNCVVTQFYGVPLNLKLSELSELKVDHTRAYYNGEGNYNPEATLLVSGNVLLQLEFGHDEDPALYQLKTSSPGAVGPRGVAIGATLKDVQRRWPEGNVYWSLAHGPYVAFTNGTNVYFEFDPDDMPPQAFDNPPVPTQTASGEWTTPRVKKVVPDPEKLKVTAIRITSGNADYTCPNSDGKTK